MQKAALECRGREENGAEVKATAAHSWERLMPIAHAAQQQFMHHCCQCCHPATSLAFWLLQRAWLELATTALLLQAKAALGVSNAASITETILAHSG